MRLARKREMVDHVRGAWRVSIRRACRAVPVDRSTYHYRSKRAGQAPLINRIKEIVETRVRYGYRRIHVLLRREGGGLIESSRDIQQNRRRRSPDVVNSLPTATPFRFQS